MPIKVERLPGESIISATVSKPFNPEQDVRAMFAEFIQFRLAIQGDVALILNFSEVANHPDAFSQLVFALAEASQGIKAGKAAGVASPPIVIFVGAGPIATLASQAMEQAQYGGVRGHLCASYDEALALARSKLTTSADSPPVS